MPIDYKWKFGVRSCIDDVTVQERHQRRRNIIGGINILMEFTATRLVEIPRERV